MGVTLTFSGGRWGRRGLWRRTWHILALYTYLLVLCFSSCIQAVSLCIVKSTRGLKHGLKLRSKFKRTLPAAHYRVQPQTSHDVSVSQIVPARKVVFDSGMNEDRRNTSGAAFGTNQGGWLPRITALQNIWLKLELMFSTFSHQCTYSNDWLCTAQADVSFTQHSLEVSVQSKFNSQCYLLENGP